MARQGAAEQVELGCRAAGNLRGKPKPHALDEAGSLTIDRPAIEIDIMALRAAYPLHRQRHTGGQLAGSIDMPDINTGGVLVFRANDRKRRSSTVPRSLTEVGPTPPWPKPKRQT